MVTALVPKNRRVSMYAWMAVECPGARFVSSALAVTQPHDTRTPEMCTRLPVLFVRRKRCETVGPRDTEPKSLESSVNSASAQEPAQPGAARQSPAPSTSTYRNMVNEPFPACGSDRP